MSMRQTTSNMCCSKRSVPLVCHVRCGALWHANTKQDKVYTSRRAGWPAGHRTENRRRPPPPSPPPWSLSLQWCPCYHVPTTQYTPGFGSRKACYRDTLCFQLGVPPTYTFVPGVGILKDNPWIHLDPFGSMVPPFAEFHRVVVCYYALV